MTVNRNTVYPVGIFDTQVHKNRVLVTLGTMKIYNVMTVKFTFTTEY
jgi:hypothetical protein